MPETIDPTLAAAIGRECHATYRGHGPAVDSTGTARPENVVARAAGRLGLILDGDCPTGIALETDGGATLIALADLLTLEVEA